MRDHHRRFSCIALALLFAVAACESPASPPENVPVTRFMQAGFSGFDSRQRLVIRSQREWEDVWRTLWRRTSDVPALPVIDFTHDMVIVAANGLQPNPGHTVLIDSASATSRTMTVTVRSVSPGSNCVNLQVIVSPIDVVRLPRREDVTFAEQTEIRACG